MLARSAREAGRAARRFTTSSAAKAGHSTGGYDDYLHAPNMYKISQMSNRKLKFGLGVVALVGLGGAIPWIACQWQFKKARG